MNIVALEKPAGVVIQFGGQTPLRLALPLFRAGVPIFGTSPTPSTSPRTASASAPLLTELDIPQPESRHRHLAGGGQGGGDARRIPGARASSYVLGGRGHVHRLRRGHLEGYVRRRCWPLPSTPILVDRFLEDAYEVDVDAVGDGHARRPSAGSSSTSKRRGSTAATARWCCPPTRSRPRAPGDHPALQPASSAWPCRLNGPHERAIRDQGGRGLRARGSTRAPRAPPPSSARPPGCRWPRSRPRIRAGRSRADQGLIEDLTVPASSSGVRLPFPQAGREATIRWAGDEVDLGEVMGISEDFGIAFAKSQSAAGYHDPHQRLRVRSASTTTTRRRCLPLARS